MVVRGGEGRGMGDEGQMACSPATAPVTFVPPRARSYPPMLALCSFIPRTCSYHPQLFVPRIPGLVCAPVLVCTPHGHLMLVCTPADEPANSLTAYFRNSHDLLHSLERAGAIMRIRDILPTTHDLFQLIPMPSDPFRPISQ